MTQNKIKKEYLVILILFFINLIIWFFNFKINQDNQILKVTFLDVGQGDAIFIQAPNGAQMLIDSGKNSQIVNQLGKTMGFFDNEIDIFLATHPDQDHIGGAPMVLERYIVKNFIDSLAEGETKTYELLSSLLKNKKINYYLGKRGMIVWLDKKAGVYFQILYPEPDEFLIEDTNELSIIGRLVYGETSFMLTGDAGKFPETLIYSNDKKIIQSNVLKAGHHGSKNSSSRYFVQAVNPAYAVISAGKDNSYGHPHKEVLSIFEDFKIKVLETSKEGNIKFFSNGTDIWNN